MQQTRRTTLTERARESQEKFGVTVQRCRSAVFGSERARNGEYAISNPLMGGK
jgi:hypothetical protein